MVVAGDQSILRCRVRLKPGNNSLNKQIFRNADGIEFWKQGAEAKKHETPETPKPTV
jgi:hypothetical protein